MCAKLISTSKKKKKKKKKKAQTENEWSNFLPRSSQGRKKPPPPPPPPVPPPPFLIVVNRETSSRCASHPRLVFLCLLVLVLLLPPFLISHWHVVTFLSIISHVVSSDERLLAVHAELSRAEHAAERTPSLARTTQEERYRSAIESVCSGDPKWRLLGVTYLPP